MKKKQYFEKIRQFRRSLVGIRNFKRLSIFFFLFLFTFYISTSCNDPEPSKLTVATSANMKFAMEELIASFEKESGINCEMIVGSSGKLTAQIKEHAPFDVFVSANISYPEDLYRSGYAVGEVSVYAYGKLILLSAKKNAVLNLNDLTGEDIRHIALGNPKTAPYGKAAIEVLKNKGLYERLKDKMVYGESISQVDQFIFSGAADVGFTAKPVVISSDLKKIGSWINIDQDLYQPIAQGVIILNNRDDHLMEAQRFQKYLLSGKAKEILNKFGYSVNK